MSSFESFSFQHFATLIFIVLFTYAAILIGRKSNDKMKMWIGYSIASLSFAFLVIDLIKRYFTGRLDILVDLPFFLCDLVALILPVIIFQRNRKWLGIIYFWALAGTSQALITPDLESHFLTFDFFRYFFMHGGIVSAIIYCIVVWKIKITWLDLWNAVLYVQFYIIGVHAINLILRSNYSYTMAKPTNPTVLDFLGVWPWYLFWAEVLMMVLFVLLLLPFLILKSDKNENLAFESEMNRID